MNSSMKFMEELIETYFGTSFFGMDGDAYWDESYSC